MSTAVHPLLVLLLVVGAFLLGIRRGRVRERRRTSDANNQAFAAGFRAGHLQGWRDGQAALEPVAATIPPAPAAAPLPAAAPTPAQPAPPPARPDQPTPPPRPAAHQQPWPLPLERSAPPALEVTRAEAGCEGLAVRVGRTPAFPRPPPAEAQQEGNGHEEDYQQGVDSGRHGYPS